eukprot:772035-Rhodomonas_salina.1
MSSPFPAAKLSLSPAASDARTSCRAHADSAPPGTPTRLRYSPPRSCNWSGRYPLRLKSFVYSVASAGNATGGISRRTTSACPSAP